jgi:hypothetical protein
MSALRSGAIAVGVAAAVAVMTTGAAPVRAGEAFEPKLVSHRAAYEITLHQSREGVGPTAARGLMAYEFTDACERWVVENRIVLDVVYGEETPVRTDWAFTSWETKDGRDYGFSLNHKRNGQISEELKGTARLDPEKGGEAAFTGDTATQVPLPAGTMFPTAHLIASLKAANAGKKVFSHPMFDGGSLDNPYETNIYIVRPKRRDVKARDLLNQAGLKAGLPVWRYQSAFFSLNAGEGTPLFELEVDYRADGVAERIIQSFSDFSIRMTPVKIEPIKGGC